jgi:hypothetical protein
MFRARRPAQEEQASAAAQRRRRLLPAGQGGEPLTPMAGAAPAAALGREERLLRGAPLGALRARRIFQPAIGIGDAQPVPLLDQVLAWRHRIPVAACGG